MPHITHSSGPWRADIDHHRTQQQKRMALVTTTNGRMSIDCTRSGETYPQDCANARLIAAAPELLAALKNLVCDKRACEGEACMAGHAAIAKAEGRSNKL